VTMLKKFVTLLCFFLPSAPTRFLYRRCGFRIGKRVKIPLFSYVCADKMIIGNDVDIRRFVYIDVNELTVGANTIISYGNQIKGDASFTCGDNCFLGVHCLIHCAEDVTLGFYSGLGPRCIVYSHGSFLPVTMGYPAKFAAVVIEDYVWIAMDVVLMPGAHIERNCIVNPGVVIQKRIKSDSFVQLSASHYEIRDLGRLQKFAKRDIPYWHHQIISSFLKSQFAPVQHDEGAANYTVPYRYMFVSHPDTNSIELLIAGKRIVYDIGQFYADSSRFRIHKEFLSYIRLHHGLTLRTRER
jgi:acetyltransferase-like isoleucine patch superfamily enzyme